MSRMPIAAMAALSICAGAVPAAAATVTDPVGDFLPSFVGDQTPDLDVTSFSVTYNPATEIFTIGASFAGAIVPELDNYYVIGVNTGAGAIAPFGSIGQPNVVFDRVILVEGEGEASVGGIELDEFTIDGNRFTVLVPLSLLPSTGFNPLDYGFNLWPRNELNPANNFEISDFAPENALLKATAVPEPRTWGMLLLGFAGAGLALRRTRRAAARPQLA